ncbi:DNA/RNA helicase domain-containing protein [Leuconostoc palmae]|uniref:DNA/RNA helicase domain-containing protein n=1 Tax=Leuconostoc palmae TaxID=501487 RepID=UPI001C7CEC4B|nr:DNA/RNA helicase domain-containing protein [Leuconostoc palmae]
MKLYELIRQKREEKGYTQDDVAQILNVTRQAVQNWEKNKRAIPNELLADYFELLGFNAQEILSVFGFIDNGNLQLSEIDYSQRALDDFAQTAEDTILTNYPTVYLGIGKKTNQHSGVAKQLVYVGEASSIVRRTNQHLKSQGDKLNAIKDDSDDQSETLYIIGHSRFNKSATLEIEQMFMDHLLGDEKFEKIYNGRNNGLSNDFYEREAYRSGVFSEIWNRLYQKNIVSSLESVQNSALFANSPFKSLSSEQEHAKNVIGLMIAETLINGLNNSVIKVQGLAGSGKTVLLSQLFYEIWKNPYPVLNYDRKTKHQASIVLLVRHEQQRRTYEQIARKLNMGIDVVMDVPRFISIGKQVDVLLVDEAHLLWSGNYGRVNKNKWQPDLIALHKLARTMVLVYDPKQVTSVRNNIDGNETLFNIVNGPDTKTLYLKNQWRIQANKETQQWIGNLAHFKENSLTIPPVDDNYQIKFFDNAKEFKLAIEEQNRDVGLSRMVATYDWKYSQGSRPKNSEYWTVTFGDQVVPWNLELSKVQEAQKKQVPWQEIPESIAEIGSDFTVQGIDLNYVGIILGPSVIWNDETNALDINADLSCDHAKLRKQNGTYNTMENKAYLKNIINVLLTRGVHGVYVYAVNDQLRKKLIEIQQDDS